MRLAATVWITCPINKNGTWRIYNPIILLRQLLIEVLLVRRIDLFCRKIIFNVDLLGLDAVYLTEWNIEAHKYFLNDEFAEHQLIEIRHQIWKIIKIRNCNLERYRATVEI